MAHYLMQYSMLNWMLDRDTQAAVYVEYRNKYDLILYFEDGSKAKWHVGPYVLRNDSLKLKASRRRDKGSFVPLQLQHKNCVSYQSHIFSVTNQFYFFKADCISLEKVSDTETLFYIEDNGSVDEVLYVEKKGYSFFQKGNEVHWANVA